MVYYLAISAGCGLVVIGVLVIALAHQVTAGTLERNGLFGIRTPATRASDAAWQAGHQAAQPIVRRTGPVAVLVGLLPVVAAAVLEHTARDAAQPVATGLSVAGYVLVLGLLTWAAIRADRAAGRARPDRR